MIAPDVLGRRIKFFRERTRMSQLDLETSIGASAGMLSRIEKGRVNPTKETVRKIGDVLNLSNREVDYIIGMTFYPASEDCVAKIRGEIAPYFRKRNVLAYLLDDRNRLIDISATFLKLLKWDARLLKIAKKKTLIEIVLDPEFGIRGSLSSQEYPSTIEHMLKRYYFEMGFMSDDEYHIHTMRAIESDPIAKRVWENLLADPPKFFNTLSSRKVIFKVFGMNIPLVYSVEPVTNNSRFELIEYTPTNKMFKLLKRIL